jgi:catechol 2,3-dioxygenase-like lactoylglutathione lyase family enzyme
MKPSVDGVLETSLYVDNLERSRAFYGELFGFDVLVSDARMEALSVSGKHVLLLFLKGASMSVSQTPMGVLPPHDGQGSLHLAFAISAKEYGDWEQRLNERGIEIESRVEWPRGGRSLYFRDPDGHLLELVTPGCWAIY